MYSRFYVNKNILQNISFSADFVAALISNRSGRRIFFQLCTLFFAHADRQTDRTRQIVRQVLDAEDLKDFVKRMPEKRLFMLLKRALVYYKPLIP